jgi:hypothetical protein
MFVQRIWWKQAMDESLTVASDTDAAETVSAVETAAVSATAVLIAAEAEAVTAVAVVTATKVSAAAAAVTAAELLQPAPLVLYTNRTRPKPFEMIELDEEAFKVEDKYGKIRSDAAARMGKCRAVNEFVNTILGDSFSAKYTPHQLLFVLRESSKHPNVRLLFKSAGLTNVEELDAL